MTRLIAAVSMLVAGMVHAGSSQDWTSLNNPGASFDIRAFGSQGEWVFVCMQPGMARSNDAGQTWEPIDDFDGLPDMVEVAGFGKGGGVIAANRTARLFRSDDFGDTWEEIPSPELGAIMGPLVSNGEAVYAITFPPNGTIADGRLWRSRDRGDTWEEVQVPDGPHVLHADGDLLLAGVASDAGFSGRLLRSTDAGATWTEVISSSFSTANGIAELDGHYYTAIAGAVQHSTDAGATWSPLGNTPPGGTFVAGDNGELFAFGGDPFVWKSLDYGATWTAHDSGVVVAGPSARAFHHHSGHLFVGGQSTDLQVSKTSEPDWQKRVNGLAYAHIIAAAADSDDVFAVPGGTRELWRLRAGESEFDVRPVGGDDPDLQFAQVLELFNDGEGVLFAGTQTVGIFRSDDNGETWVELNQGVPQYNGTAGVQYREIEGFTRAGGTIVAATGFGLEFVQGQFVFSGGGAIRSTNDGQSWQRINAGLPVNTFNDFGDPVFDPMQVIESIDGVLLAGHFSRGVFRSTNNGASWSEANSGFPADLLNVTTLAKYNGDLYLGGFVPGSLPVWKSTDDGVTWTAAGSGLPINGTCNDLIVFEGTLYAGLGFSNHALAGVYRLDDDDTTWQPVGTALNGRSVTQLTVRGDTLFAGTLDRSLWQLGPVSTCPHDVDGSGAVGVPDLLSLLADWGLCSDCPADFDGNGSVDVNDLLALLANWGPCS